MIRYTTELVVKALGLKPIGEPHTGETCVCGLCQRAIRSGELSSPMNMKKSFMDHHKTAASHWVCGFCEATLDSSVLRCVQRALITENGIFNLNKDEARAWLWLTPPEPPFSVVINNSTFSAFHFFWRTPVTLDKRWIQANVDDVIYVVRQHHVLKALDYAQTILKHLADHPAKGRREKLNSPFFILSRAPTAADQKQNGHLLAEVAALRTTHPAFIPALDFLDTLNPGELVALSPMLKKNPTAPAKPSLTTLNDETDTEEKETEHV